MDWFMSSKPRPLKDVEWYQRKVLSFLYSAEGRDDFRCLNIPLAPLGFYSPLHFISCIPMAMCEPYRNDKLFLASYGELRRGDKVLLLEKGTDGVIKSAIFKGRRIGRSDEPEIILDGHRHTYTEEEVVPYKAHLREHLGTALVPERDYVISCDGVPDWEEPTWEPGQEVFYKPEKRWAIVLTRDVSARGREFVSLKMDPTNTKKEKIFNILLDDLIASSAPLRAPKRVQGFDDTERAAVSTLDDVLQDVTDDSSQMSGSKNHETIAPKSVRIDEGCTNGGSPGGGNPIYATIHQVGKNKEREREELECSMDLSSEPQQEVSKMKSDKKKSSSSSKPVAVIRKKSSSKRATNSRPVTEYYPEPASPMESSTVYQNPEPLKSKSFSNLNNMPVSDDEEQFELEHYTNSLRSSARKIIQRQIAQQDAEHRATSLKLRPAAIRPHVAEIFSVDNSGKMTKRVVETTTSYNQPIMTSTTTSNAPSTRDMAHPNYQEARVSPVVFGARSSSNGYLAALAATTPTSNTRSTSNGYHHAATPRPVTPTRLTPAPSDGYQHQYYHAANSNNLARSPSQPEMRSRSPTPLVTNGIDETDRWVTKSPASLTARQIIEQYQQNPVPPIRTKRSAPPKTQELEEPHSPLEFNFLPLSSSELVKRQLTVLNRVLQQPPPRPNKQFILSEINTKSAIPTGIPQQQRRKNHETTCLSSDSSSHDNDSGRGSFQFSETYKSTEEIVEDVSSKRTVSSPTMNSSMNYLNKHSENSYGNGVGTPGNGNISPTRRYTKNRAVTKHPSINKYNMSTKEDAGEPEEDSAIPMPFSRGNVASLAGYGRGIQGALNSSYADATLFALFTCSNIFDRELLISKPGHVERGVQKDVRKILRQKIVAPLRSNAYCKSENVTHLREAMLPLSSKMHSPLMDAEEFLSLLFDTAMNTESFLEFSNGTKEFIHQIIARPKDRSKSQTVQFMLETSLGTSSLKFKHSPNPALFLCMPRCKGRLVYYEAIIPSLQINITKLLNHGPKQCVCEMAATLECTICHRKNGDMALDFCGVCKGIADQVHFRLDHSPVLVAKAQSNEMLNLHSIICTRGNRYVTFVKVSEERLSPWLFFDSLAGDYPEVTLLEDFGKWLDSLEKQPGHYREFAKLHPLLKRIMTDSHIYIYSRMHTILEDPECTESLVI